MGIGIAAKRVDCPLTWVERWARTKAAMTPLSPDGFVAHYITGVIYPAGCGRRSAGHVRDRRGVMDPISVAAASVGKLPGQSPERMVDVCGR